MKFSLILCTVNRTQEVITFLDSLLEQSYPNFEVIIVDQNIDDKINKIIQKYSSLKIIHLKSELGLSKSRNKGLQKATGNIVSFPDDDCQYPSELLKDIKIFFDNTQYDILMGKTIDKNTKMVVAGSESLKEQELTPFYTLGSSTTLFIRINDNIVFDEKFGLGAIFGSEEENELVFRLLKQKYKGYYSPSIDYVYHPPTNINFNDLERIKQRSVGLGAFIAKHLFSKEGLYYFLKFNIFRSLAGSLFFLVQMDFVKSKYYFYKWIGIWKGFIKYFRLKSETSL